MVINKGKPEDTQRACNCRVPENCPLQGECQQGPVIYQADVKTNSTTKKYIGSTEGTFKARFNSHKHSLSNKNANSTTLSTYVWALKDAGKEYDITWKVIAKTGKYTPGAIYCDVCLTEKTYILLADPKESLNVRSEILNKCRHMAKFTLEKV